MKIKNLHKPLSSNSRDSNNFLPKPSPGAKRQSFFSSQPDLSKINNNKNSRSFKNVASAVKSATNGNLSNSMSNQSNTSQRSVLIDRSSQTTDVDSEYFLKDAIIRYPSTTILTTKSGGGDLNDVESKVVVMSAAETARKQQIDNLVEFLETGSIKKDISSFDLEKIEKRLSELRTSRYSSSSASTTGGRPQSFTSIQNPQTAATVAELSSRGANKAISADHVHQQQDWVENGSVTGSYASRASVGSGVTNKSELPLSKRFGCWL